jgi:hypothetical protein
LITMLKTLLLTVVFISSLGFSLTQRDSLNHILRATADDHVS